MKKKKNFKLRLVVFLLFDAFVIFTMFKLMTHTPGEYQPIDPIVTDEVSPYITHELAQQFYNGVGQGQDFELVITQEGINDVIARKDWPIYLDNALLESAYIIFVPDTIKVMAKVTTNSFNTVVAAELLPKVDLDGKFLLSLGSVKAGELPIRLIVMTMLRRSAQENLAGYDTDAIERKIASSVLDNIPFDPVIQMGDKEVRILDIVVEQGQIRIRLQPISG